MKKLTSKNYVRIYVVALLVFLGFHSFMYFIYDPYIAKPVFGDLSRMSGDKKISISRNIPRLDKDAVLLSYKKDDDNNFPIITIGDSFTRGEGQGGYYQDFLVKYTGKRVLIMNFYGFDDMVYIINSYLKDGLFEKYGVKYVILETIERQAVERFVDNFDLDKTIDLSRNVSRYKRSRSTSSVLIFDKKHYNLFKKTKKNNAVNFFDLDEELFTSKKPRTLAVFHDDIDKMNKTSIETANKLNDNVNKLADRLNEQGVKLFFFVCADKYGVYKDHVVGGDNLPENKLFEYLDSFDNKRYMYINMKEIAKAEVAKGTQNVYWPDDTHWSRATQELVVREIANQINSAE